MKKKAGMIFLIAIVLIGLCYFVFDVTIIRTDGVVMKDKPLENAMVEPIPAEGNVVATINGSDYYYDENYLFLMDPETYLFSYDSKELTEDDVKEVVLRELYALEADLLGLSYADATNPDYDTEKDIRASHDGRFHWVLHADPADDPSAADITEKQRKQATRYFELRDRICAEQQISPDTLWEWADPYVRKELLIRAYEEFVGERFREEYADGDMLQNGDRFSQYCKTVDKALMKKYDVELLYEK